MTGPNRRTTRPGYPRIGIAAAVLAISLSLTPNPANADSLLDNAKSLLNQTLGDSPSGAGDVSLSRNEIAQGLKQALEVGSKLVVDNLGAKNGFNTDPVAHIPLPQELQKAQDLMSKVGLSGLGDEVELKMNRAAESAMDESGEVVINAIHAMTLDDAQGILQGPDDAATQYLMRVGGDDIKSRIRPIVEQALAEVGAIDALDRMMAGYDTLPFVPDVKGNLTEHATQKAFDGLFHYIAEEEAAIRENPAKRTTDLLRRVFAQQ